MYCWHCVFRVWFAFSCVSLRVWFAGVTPHVLRDARGHTRGLPQHRLSRLSRRATCLLTMYGRHCVFRVWSAFPCVLLRVWSVGVVPQVLRDARGVVPHVLRDARGVVPHVLPDARGHA